MVTEIARAAPPRADQDADTTARTGQRNSLDRLPLDQISIWGSIPPRIICTTK